MVIRVKMTFLVQMRLNGSLRTGFCGIFGSNVSSKVCKGRFVEVVLSLAYGFVDARRDTSAEKRADK